MIKQLCNNFFKLNRKKIFKLKASISLVLLLSILSGTLTAYAEDIHTVNIKIDGNSKYYRTGDIILSDFLEKNNIKLGEKDIISPSLDFNIQGNDTIYIDRAENITFNIKGEEPKKFVSNAKDIQSAIVEFQKETARSFKLAEGQNPNNKLTNNMVINLIPYTEKINTSNQEIPFQTIYVENANLELGKQIVKTEGINGLKEIKIKEVYLENNLVSSSQISEKVIKQPINKVIEKGTKKPVNIVKTNKGNQTYKNKFTMKSTAYTAGPESTGKKPGDKGYGITASGMKAQRGVVAVDTKIIPFGTKLYIEGYGYAVAGDTGSAIKGNKVDVFMNTVSEARNWGVRNVNVYVLE